MTTHRDPYGALLTAMVHELDMVGRLTGIDKQFHRRLIVRVFFSALEACAFFLKQRSLNSGQAERVAFSKDELEKLTERRTVVMADGSARREKRFLPSQANLNFALKIYSKVMKASPTPPVPADEMTRVERARERLTHPKTVDALVITDKEEADLVRLVAWFRQAVDWFGNAEVAYLARIGARLAALRRSIEQRNATRPKA